jgi:hypothetical protein
MSEAQAQTNSNAPDWRWQLAAYAIGGILGYVGQQREQEAAAQRKAQTYTHLNQTVDALLDMASYEEALAITMDMATGLNAEEWEVLESIFKARPHPRAKSLLIRARSTRGQSA